MNINQLFLIRNLLELYVYIHTFTHPPSIEQYQLLPIIDVKYYSWSQTIRNKKGNRAQRSIYIHFVREKGVTQNLKKNQERWDVIFLYRGEMSCYCRVLLSRIWMGVISYLWWKARSLRWRWRWGSLISRSVTTLFVALASPSPWIRSRPCSNDRSLLANPPVSRHDRSPSEHYPSLHPSLLGSAVWHLKNTDIY